MLTCPVCATVLAIAASEHHGPGRRIDSRNVALATDGWALVPVHSFEGFLRLSPHLTRLLGPVAEGKSNHEIAAELWLAPHTVECYVSEILLTTGCQARPELVAHSNAFLQCLPPQSIKERAR
ncbi:MAG: helix-turn-helix transcriptional regulator [Chloroflexi bacterium]|nr:helix-turn-helix transcriptional regulator [Chloroflexota bacterium]